MSEKGRYLEYQTIRQEILDCFKDEFNAMTLSLTATLAIIGYGLANSNNSPYSPFIFLLPLIILAFGLIKLVQTLYQVLTLATFIRVRIEQFEQDMTFESYMYKERSESYNKNNPFRYFSIVFYFWLFSLTGLISITISFYYSFQLKADLGVIVSIFLVAWIIFLSLIKNWISDKKLRAYEDGLATKIDEELK